MVKARSDTVAPLLSAVDLCGRTLSMDADCVVRDGGALGVHVADLRASFVTRKLSDTRR